MPITLSDGTTVNATVESGAASQANSIWAFYANVSASTSVLGIPILPGSSMFLFRAEYGPNGRLIRFFDNQVLAPDSFGSQILFDGMQHAMLMPNLTYAGEGYGAENGTAVGNFGCLHIYSQIIDFLQLTIQFTGTRDDQAKRIDGMMRFITQVNPSFAAQAPPNVKSETVSVSVFATKES